MKITLRLLWPFLFILFVTLLFFWQVIVQGKVPLPADALIGAHVPWTETTWAEYPAGVPIKNQEITDSFSQFYPWRSLVGEFWRQGKVPLWNPYMFSGAPFLATWHSAALYPLNFLYLVANDISAWTGLIILQVFLSAFFMYLFLRELELNGTASLLGAFAFSFCGYMIAWLEFATGGHAGLWLPLLLLSELKLIKKINSLYLIPIAFSFFLIYTAGDFQVPFYITFAYILFGIYLIWNLKNRLRSVFLLICGLILGVLLSLPQLLPSIELFRNSVRTDDIYIQEYFYGIMNWEKIVTFLWPDFFGNVVTRNYWGKFGFHEYLAFAGSITLLFATYSFLVKRKTYETFFWILLLVSLLFLFPTPLAFLPYTFHFPGLGTSSASRIIFLVDFCLSVLAAYGLSKWEFSDMKRLMKVLGFYLFLTIGIGGGLGVAITFMKKSPYQPTDTLANILVALRNMLPTTGILIVFGCLILATILLSYRKFESKRIAYLFPLLVLSLSVIDLLRFGWKNTPFSPTQFVFPQTKITSFLQDQNDNFRIAGGIPLNLFMPFHIDSAEGYDSLYARRNSEWYSLVNTQGLQALSGRYGIIHDFSSSLLSYANVRYVVDYPKDPLGGISDMGSYATGVSSPEFEKVFDEGRISVFEKTNTLPRAWVTNNVDFVSNGDVSEKILELKDSEPKVMLESDPFSLSHEHLTSSVENFLEVANSVSLNASTTHDGVLFVSQTYDRGWKAYVDGIETPIYRANYVFQAIPLEEGRHSIYLLYTPLSFTIGKWVSLATLGLLIGIFFKKKYASK